MAPGGPVKRKRGDRSYSGDSRDEGLRPSPHRPDNLGLGQRITQNAQQGAQPPTRGGSERGRGGRRGGRGGGTQRSPLQSPSSSPQQPQTRATRPPDSTAQDVQRQDADGGGADSQGATATTKPQLPNPKADEESRSVPPERRRLAYRYQYVTDFRTQEWETQGQEEVVSSGTQARDQEDVSTLSLIFLELVQSANEGRIDAAQAGLVVSRIIENGRDAQPAGEEDLTVDGLDVSSLFLDTVSIQAETTPMGPKFGDLIQATKISPSQIRRELDNTLLEALGMIRNTFVRVGIRQQTNLLYRQSNYNLLREETEGYSKLVTEFFTTSSNEPPTTEVVQATFERVKGMIGAFDLDVGRVLDITLDVFAAVLVKQYRFFVKYLRISSWWPQGLPAHTLAAQRCLGPLPRWALPDMESLPMTDEEQHQSLILQDERDVAFWQRCRDKGLDAFFELGDRKMSDEELSTALDETKLSTLGDSEERTWIQITKTLPPSGNKVAAQILGFKLRFYSSSARDTTDALPVNLIYLAALLIKIRFISLRDLYPHIWPYDDAMESVREEKSKEKAEKEKLNRPGGGMNALLAAAPLPDDTIDTPLPTQATRLRDAEAARRQQKADTTGTSRSTPVPQAEEKPEQLPDPTEQKIQLLKSLLCIGALPEALYIMGRFPWIVDAFSDLPDYIHRILHHCLSKVYEPLRPLRDESGFREQPKIPDPDQSGVPKGHVKLIDAPGRKIMRWAQLDKEDTSDAIDYRFYWDDWADLIPVCQNVDDVFTLCSTLLNLSGVKIGKDPTLLLKLARIGNHSLAADTSGGNVKRWIDLSKRLLVPSLSLTKCNPGVVNEVFELIKAFPEGTRYNIYAEWNFGQISRLPDIKAAFEQTKAETRDVLKRISRTTIKPMARALAKVAYSSPGVVFSVAIGQLEAYENLVEAFVECARYFTYLAYDVLTWSLMSSLGAQGRNRLQSDGLLTSRWLAALSLFAGKAFKRYSVMNPLPVVQYVEHQLRQGNPTDLIVLENITFSMAGIVSDISLNESQVIAVSAGERLRDHVLQQLLDRRHESKATARRLIKPLVDSRLAGRVLISLAQEHQTCIFKVEERNAHPKLLGNVYDQIHRVLGQYLDLLRSNLTVEEFDVLVPGCTRLIADFGIDPSIAFWIARKSINASMRQYDAEQAKEETIQKVASSAIEDKAAQGSKAEENEANGDESATADKMELSEPVSSGLDDPTTIQGDEPQAAISETRLQPAANEATEMGKVERNWPCHPVLSIIAETMHQTLPEQMWEVLSPSFFATFWQLSLGDIFTTLAPYDEEIKKLNKKILDISADRSDISVTGTQRKQREKEAVETIRQSLHDEMRERLALKQAVRLRKQKDEWFADAWGKFDALNVALIEHCFFPRLVMSPVDAFFTFKMIRWLHREGTANFRTMGVYDQFFREKRLTSMIFLCSAKESESLGRFIHDVLKELGGWHADKATYEKEAYGPRKSWPGFSKKLKVGKEVDTFWDYEDFRRLLLKWHRSINNALKTCYASGEYMHIRNAINILNHIHQQFPAVNWMGNNQLNAITELSKKENREDLKIAATSLIGSLKKREKDWMLPQAFSLMDGAPGNVATKGPANGRSSTPLGSGEPVKTLNPAAPEFTPAIAKPLPNGEKVTKSTTGKGDAEDGEIEDVNMADAKMEATSKPLEQSDAKADDAVAKPDSGAAQPSISDAKPEASIGSKASSDGAADVKSATPQPAGQAQTARNGKLIDRPDRSRRSTPDARNGNAAPQPHQEGGQTSKVESREHKQSDDRGPPPHSQTTTEARDPLARNTERSNVPASRVPPPHVEDRSSRQRYDETSVRPPPRNLRSSAPDERITRSSQSRSFPDHEQSRHEQGAGYAGREFDMAPPRSTQHTERPAPGYGHQDPEGRYSERALHGRHERHSRGSSPSRLDDRPPQYDGRRSPYDTRKSYDEPMRSGRYEDSHAPIGPRGDRGPFGPPSSGSERFRESTRPFPSPSSSDPNYGRLQPHDSMPNNRDSENYGRLNASGNDQSPGPRGPNNGIQSTVRAGRSGNAAPPSALPNQPAGTNTASTASARPLNPPVATRASPRNQPAAATTSGESGPNPSKAASQGSDTSGMHPDRLKAMQGSKGTAPPNTGPAPRNTRSSQLPHSPVSGPPQSAAYRNLGISNPPRDGPDSQAQTSTRGQPPTGPADRSRGDKRFTGLNSMLSQSNGHAGASSTSPNADVERQSSAQGTTIRGRGSRTGTSSNAGSPISPSGPLPPSGPGGASSRTEPSSYPSQPHHKDDLFAGRPNMPSSGGRQDDEATGRYGRPRRGPPAPAPSHRDGPTPQEPRRPPPRGRSRSPGPPIGSTRGPPDSRGRDALPPHPPAAYRDDHHGPSRRGGPGPPGGPNSLPPHPGAPPNSMMDRGGPPPLRSRRGGPGPPEDSRDRNGDYREPMGGSSGGSLRKRGRPMDDAGDRDRFDPGPPPRGGGGSGAMEERMQHPPGDAGKRPRR